MPNPSSDIKDAPQLVSIFSKVRSSTHGEMPEMCVFFINSLQIFSDSTVK